MSIKQNDCYIDRSQNISWTYEKYNFLLENWWIGTQKNMRHSLNTKIQSDSLSTKQNLSMLGILQPKTSFCRHLPLLCWDGQRPEISHRFMRWDVISSWEPNIVPEKKGPASISWGGKRWHWGGGGPLWFPWYSFGIHIYIYIYKLFIWWKSIFEAVEFNINFRCL